MQDEEIIESYRKIAFGGIKDPIKLLFLEEISQRTLNKLDLFSVSEIKRPKGGGMEIKFFDRIKALQCLENMTRQKGTENSFFEAFENGAKNLREGGEAIEDDSLLS